jgi:hypothetical protein
MGSSPWRGSSTVDRSYPVEPKTSIVSDSRFPIEDEVPRLLLDPPRPLQDDLHRRAQGAANRLSDADALVLIVENNKWAYSTPTRKQTANTRFLDRAQAYGCAGEPVDGNDVVAVYDVVRRAIKRARSGQGPTLIEADTMRMRGHAEHDDMKYVPISQLEEWRKKDPLQRFEQKLVGRAIARPEDLTAVAARIEAELAVELAAAEASPLPEPGSGLTRVYGDREVRPPVPPIVSEWEERR